MHRLFDVYRTKATQRYGLSDINQLEHALQAAWFTEEAGHSQALVVSALFHDVGHMVHALGEHPAADGVDDHHEVLGAKYLAKFFGPEVYEPVRLHVPAKRYLVTTDSSYFAKLAPDSVESLVLQGGRMSEAEISDFTRQPFWREALILRRMDEEAKVPGLPTPPLDHFFFIAETVRESS